MSTMRVVVADDHPVVLAGIKALIQTAADMELVGEAHDGRAALEMIRATSPDVAVLDVSMPGVSGAELAQRALELHPDLKLLVLTVHEDRAYLQQLLQAGARGYVLKRSAADELVRAVRTVYTGGVYVDPAVAGKLLSRTATKATELGYVDLSNREEEVLKLAAKGFSNKETAAKLDLSIKTVETYRARAAEKLGLRTRAEIVRYAAARRWLEEP